MNKFVVFVAIVLTFLLLSPYVGIDIFGPSQNEQPMAVETPQISSRTPEQQKNTAKAVRGRTTMVEDILSSPSQSQTKDQSPQNLSDIENMLKEDGQNK